MIKKLSFEEEGFVVDWLSFKMDSFDTLDQERLANYLCQIGFNSYTQSKKSKDFTKKLVRSQLTNSFEVFFSHDLPYWDGTVLHFSGPNAKEFYNWLKQNTVNWNLFRNPRLSRLDLHYTYQKPVLTNEVELFFQTCQSNPNLNLDFQKNKRGKILKIGRRTSDRFSRIYTKKDQLRFEHEMKGRFIDNYSKIFFDQSWEDFEDRISHQFLQYFGKHLPLESLYLDWLVVKLRSIKPRPVSNLIFKMDYIHSITKIENQKKVVQFLKFLIYVRDLNYTNDYLGSTAYRCVRFRLQDYLKFQESTSESISFYKIKQSKQFFEDLQTDFLLSMFQDKKFQTLISIPKVEFWKDYHWMVKVWIVDDLFYYNYPFAFPSLFAPNTSKTKFAVQFEILRVFTSEGLEKRFEIQKFIDAYPSALSNQTIRQIKDFFLESVHLLEENNLIQPTFKVLRDGNLEFVDRLTPKNISEGFLLYETLKFIELDHPDRDDFYNRLTEGLIE